jgi:hypothetical protein
MTGKTGYGRRAAYSAAEISRVPVPALLTGLLRPGMTVAEMPSGTGHFLPAYSAAGTRITLVDACPQTLAAAQALAARSGTTVTAVCERIEDLPGRIDFELASGGSPVHRQRVTLRPVPVTEAAAALADAGMRTLRTSPGHAGLAEVLGTRQSRSPQ